MQGTPQNLTSRLGALELGAHVPVDDAVLEAQSGVSLSPTHGGCHTHSVHCDLGIAERR